MYDVFSLFTKATKAIKEYASTHHIHPAKFAHVDPRVPLEIKVPLVNQANLENVAIPVNQGRKEIREHLAILDHLDPMVHLEKMVRIHHTHALFDSILHCNIACVFQSLHAPFPIAI